MRSNIRAICATACLAITFMMTPASSQSQTGNARETFDARSLSEWGRVGDANWTLVDDVMQANKGNGFLVTKDKYSDFYLKAEFWVDDKANSGIFIRCQEQQKPSTQSGYEVNIFDERPEPAFGTGAIVGVAKVDPMPKAGGKWNVMEVTAKGAQFTIVLNGQVTVRLAEDSRFPSGYIGLQYGAGMVKFRKVEINRL